MQDIPTALTPFYTVQCEGFPESIALDPENLCAPDSTFGLSEDDIGIPRALSWLYQGCRVEFMYGDSMCKRTFELDKEMIGNLYVTTERDAKLWDIQYWT